MNSTKKHESLFEKTLSFFHVVPRHAIIITFISLVLFSMGISFISCSLNQDLEGSKTVTIPVFESYTPITRAVYMDQEKNNTKQYFLSLPPVVGWETTDVSSTSTTIDFDFLDTTVTCDIELFDDRVTFTGANDSIDLIFTVYNDGRFSYTGIVLSERTNDDSATTNYWDLFETTIEGEIEGDFISGTGGIFKTWEINPQHSYNSTEPSEDCGSLIFGTYDVGIERGFPFFRIVTFDETDKNASYYQDPSTITIESWESKRGLFDTVFNLEELSSVGMTLYLNEGSWGPHPDDL
jgi:hypothetical protein